MKKILFLIPLAIAALLCHWATGIWIILPAIIIAATITTFVLYFLCGRPSNWFPKRFICVDCGYPVMSYNTAWIHGKPHCFECQEKHIVAEI